MTKPTEADLQKNAVGARERYFGGESSQKSMSQETSPGAFTYKAALDQHGDTWLHVTIRGLSGQYTLYYYDTAEITEGLEFSADLKIDQAPYGKFSAFVYNSISGEDTLTFLLSKDEYEKTGKFIMAIAEGTFSSGDTPPWKIEDYFLADRTHP